VTRQRSQLYLVDACPSPVITLRDATVVFEGASRPALDRISIEITPGSWTAIVGPNGSGKSTLLAALAGLVPLRRGTLERKGAPRVALLLQDADDQLVATSVRHELALSVPLAVADSARAARIAAAITRFDLAHLLDRNPHTLSGGEKQRLACATVWLEEPDILLLDEPLSFLDADARARVIDFVRETNARGAAVVWAEPDAPLAHTYVYLENGRVVQTTSEHSGARRHEKRVRTSPIRGEVVIKIHNASFSYDGRLVLQSIDLEVAKGECVGIVGLNSAGKSTLLTLAGGALKPASGRVVRTLGDGGVLYLPQTPERMFFAETVREEIEFGLKRRVKRGDRTHIERVVQESLRAVGLDPSTFIERSPFQLSFGETRRVAFAIAHASAPELLLLDEPASCLDDAGRDVLAALVESRVEAGAAVVVASHDPSHLVDMCDRVLKLEGGRLTPTQA
jgi:energy-coupling factor transporter ATP-binding protein EcfA2